MRPPWCWVQQESRLHKRLVPAGATRAISSRPTTLALRRCCAKIMLNDEKQKTANDELTATTLLIGKKAGSWIGLGETVRLKVRNSDGAESPEFIYSRPLQ